jgi:hypothetical protein
MSGFRFWISRKDPAQGASQRLDERLFGIGGGSGPEIEREHLEPAAAGFGRELGEERALAAAARSSDLERMHFPARRAGQDVVREDETARPSHLG